MTIQCDTYEIDRSVQFYLTNNGWFWWMSSWPFAESTFDSQHSLRNDLQRIHTYIYNVSWFSFLTLVTKNKNKINNQSENELDKM